MTATRTRAKRKTIVILRTPGGVITSFREAWQDWAGRPVFTWRTDRDRPPHDFGSVDAAFAFKVAIWCCSSTRREVEERERWVIEEVDQDEVRR